MGDVFRLAYLCSQAATIRVAINKMFHFVESTLGHARFLWFGGFLDLDET